MTPSITSTTPSTPTRSRPGKKQNTVSIFLAESAVFLRTNDATGRNRYGDSQPSIVRGLLVLDVVKPMKISAIELELIAKSATAWPEGVGAHRTDITEVHRVFEAKEVVWAAPGYIGSRPGSSKGKRTPENSFQMETVEEDNQDLEESEPQPPSYTQSIRASEPLQMQATPVSDPRASVTSSLSSARTSISTTSTSLSSAFTMTPSTSAASASSAGSGLLASVKPFEESIPKTYLPMSPSPAASIPSTTHTTRITPAGFHTSHTVSRPPPVDNLPENDNDNNAHAIDANAHDLNVNRSVALPLPSTCSPELEHAVNFPNDDTEPHEATLPLVPNRPISTTTPLDTRSAPSANLEPESDSRGRTTETKKRKFSIFSFFGSLFGSKKKRKREKGNDRHLDSESHVDNRREGKGVEHSRSRLSMKSLSGATVRSEETVKPKERPSSFLKAKREKKARSVLLPPLPPPPTSAPPVPISSGSSVRSAPAPHVSTSLRQSLSSAINAPDPSSSDTYSIAHSSHPYAHTDSTSIAPPSPTASTITNTATVISAKNMSGPPSAKPTGLMGLSDILRDRDHRERRKSKGYSHDGEGSVIDGKEESGRRSTSEEAPEGLGWKEFRKGTYTYPITLRIPGHAPPTLECTYGSVTWRIKGVVRRHGTFSANLSTTSPLLVISCPAPLLYSPSAPTDPFYGGLEENIVVERHWEDQLHYSINVSGRSFHMGPGATIGVAFTFVPLCRGVRVWRVGVAIEEKTEYLTQFRRVARTDPVQNIPLLSLRDPNTNSKEQKWLLPLPEGMMIEESPMKEVLGNPDTSTSDPGDHSTCHTSADVSESHDTDCDTPIETQTEDVAPVVDAKYLPRAMRRQQSTLLLRQRDETMQSLQSPHGPWSFHADLPLPASCRVIRASNRNRRSNMNITHLLKCVVRVERGEHESDDDMGEEKRKEPKKRKLFDIVIQTPVQILSCRCSPDYISLPHYSEDVELESIDPGSSMMCPCQRYSNSIRDLERPPSVLGSTWSGKRGSIGSVGSGDKVGTPYTNKRSSVSSIASFGSALAPSVPPSPLPFSPPHLQGSTYSASRRSSLAFSFASGASTTAFSVQNFKPAVVPTDTLAARNKQLERLVSGSEWEDGWVVPVYNDVGGPS
ncbi:hypothetical protein L218DRAFT_899196 [Marasmius fiardii PR-910]|nr:hypothetical protein L218DRAFT_899196 [Marasmius fiardii PR-910]